MYSGLPYGKRIFNIFFKIKTQYQNSFIMSKQFLFIYIFIACFLAVKSDKVARNTEVSTYGVYCGEGHTNYLGEEPLDELDRICQIHDYCVSALGYTSCACNEQLYAAATDVYVTSPEQISMRDYILSWIYEAIMPCSNYNGLGKWYFLNANYLGQNYLPFFPYKTGSKYIHITANDLFKYHLMARSNYKEFALAVVNKNRVSFTAQDFYEGLVEIKPNEVLVALTYYSDGDKAASLEVFEIDANTSLKLQTEMKKSQSYKKTFIIVVSILATLFAGLVVIFVISLYRQRNNKAHKGYKLHQNEVALGEDLNEEI